ncbi:MAG: DUF3833 family protein [Parvularcula sp.]|jgi:hypothetical protein|nr:DUF3833 family protein [Parvularcula sp.]
MKRLLSLVLTLGACASSSLPELDAFDPVAFFEGETRGRGVLTTRAGAIDAAFTVKSEGRVEDDGELVLTQAISMGDEPGRVRTWTMRSTGPGRWEGDLTDAKAPVALRAQGGALTLSYAPNDIPFGRITQHLYLQPPGDTLINEGRVTVLGVTVRRMHEVIEKQPTPQNGAP